MSDKYIEIHLVNELSQIIDQGKHQIAVQVNSAMTMVSGKLASALMKSAAKRAG